MYKVIHLFFILLILPGCLQDQASANPIQKETLLIQAISDSAPITEAIHALTPLINTIIKQELQLAPDYEFNFFLPKKLQRITLYYMNDVISKDNHIIISELNTIPLLSEISHGIEASAEAHFFGDQQDELIIMIKDTDGALSDAHQKLMLAMHTADQRYHDEHNQHLYNREQSERFPFSPHMGLGRIRLQSIKNHIPNDSQTQVVLDRIKKRITQLAKETAVKYYKSPTTSLHFTKIALLDLKKQTYLNEWTS